MPWILPAQGLLLLCLVLQSGSWSPDASEEPFTIITPLLSSSSGNNSDPLTCQTFQCFGERCYQEAVETHGNGSWESCHNASHCQLLRVNSTTYTAGCSSACGNGSSATTCGANGSVSTEPCAMECCSSPNCLRLNATVYGDLSPAATATTTSPAPTTTTTTTTTAAPQNGKVCGHFTCHGEGCYRRQHSSMSCPVGYDFCEMKRSGPAFVAGCSRACQKTGPACATGSREGPCFQECCPAQPGASCLKLDGKVHLHGAGALGVAALPPLLACAATLLSLTFALPPLPRLRPGN